MKQTLHKLLCMLLVVCMVCSMVPAAFAGAVDEPIPEPEHRWGAPVSNGDGTHTSKCLDEGCEEVLTEPCNGIRYVQTANGHQHFCDKCGGVFGAEEPCNYVWTRVEDTLTHVGNCQICGKQTAPVPCTDEDQNGLCDVCGGKMEQEPTPELKTIVSIAPVRGIEVALGTTIDKLDLPSIVTGYTEKLERVNCSVVWSCPNYDANKPGVYAFIGTVTAPEGYVLADTATVSVSVTVTGDYTLEISAEGGSVAVGATKSLVATIKAPADALKDLRVDWSVDDTTGKIATVVGASTFWNNRHTATLRAVSCGNSTSYKNVVVTATLRSGTQVLATDSVTVRIIPATASTIRANASANGVTFTERAFYSALSYGPRDQLSYITFDASTKGTFYSDNTRFATRLTSSSKCYYNYSSLYHRDGYDLDTVYFEYGSNVTGAVTLSYVAYNNNGYVIATGTIELTGLTATIRYQVGVDGTVTFNEDDFRDALRAENYSYNSTLDYVQFDMSEAVFGNSYGGSSKYGYLYVDSTLKTKLTTSNDSYKFAYRYNSSSSRYYYDLDDVTYVAGSATTKYSVTIPFVAYGTKNESFFGTVEIVVDEGAVDARNIDVTGTSFKKIVGVIADAYPNASYLMLEQPDSGTLYYDYDAINNYDHKVRSNYAYYLNSSSRNEYDLADVYLVPAAGAKKVTVRFDVYNGKTRIDSGSISFSVSSRTSSYVFNDVTYTNTGSWSADSVDFMNANGLIYGTGKNRFNPNGTMTRGDLVLILYRLAGQPSVSNVSNPFKDVKSSDYYYKAVLWAYANRVVNGTGRDTFSPTKAISREQLAAILYRYSGSPSSSMRLGAFTDANKVSSFATDAMKWAVGAGIITGSGSKLDPQSSATRAQVAAMLHRYLTK